MPEEWYYRLERGEMLSFVPQGTATLLDIGCAEGYFVEAVKKKYPQCETWGVEPDAAAAQEAAKRVDHVLCDRFEHISTLPVCYFDTVIMNDSLEHFQYPEPVLRTVAKLLKQNGALVLSLPNVRFYPVVRDLLFRNDWEYQDSGVLDRTHFRFFTTKSARRLLERNGFRVETLEGINFVEFQRAKYIFSLAPKFFETMRHMQFAIVARPAQIR
ncbi:MAG: class I SAM-dependent methyltransferase [Hyphomicrobiales bacterium]|nr:class I SAM-dependent methyltransferase [Hyphomicrobiales bacterium]